MEITIFNGKIHYKWPFSIAMLVYQRVHVLLTCDIAESRALDQQLESGAKTIHDQKSAGTQVTEVP